MLPHSLTLFMLLLCSLHPSQASDDQPTKYFEVTHPLTSDHQSPTCSLLLFSAQFSGALVSPALSAPPPIGCLPPWTAVIAEFSAICSGRWPPRVVALWVSGVEILRTSTVATVDEAATWTVQKDVTRYISAFVQPNVTYLLSYEKVRNDAAFEGEIGTLQVNVSLHFYGIGVSSEAVKAEGVENGVRPSRKVRFWEDNKWESSSGESEKNEGKLEFPWKENSMFEEENENENDEWDEGTQVEMLEENTLAAENRVGFSSGEKDFSKPTLKLPSEGLNMMNKNNPLKSNLFYRDPADLIIPIGNIVPSSSDNNNNNNNNNNQVSTAPWFRIQTGFDLPSCTIKIPQNTYRAVIEICVSPHSIEEFWYANAPQSFLESSNITINRAHGAFRQVFANIDGLYVGSAVPFPLVYSDGINPLFWKPIVSMGAFQIPSYDLDVTPFLGNLLDGYSHSVSLGITDANKYWLVNANLHLWLDKQSTKIAAKLIKYRAPGLVVSRKFKFRSKEGIFKITARRELHFAGWVNSSIGNITTNLKYNLHFTNKMEVSNNGDSKDVAQSSLQEKLIKLEALSDELVARFSSKIRNPLELQMRRTHKEKSGNFTTADFKNDLDEVTSWELPTGSFSSSLNSRQECEGRRPANGESLLSALANNHQTYSFKFEKTCYFRNVISKQGDIAEDKYSSVCGEDV